MVDWSEDLIQVCLSDAIGFDLAGMVDVLPELEQPNSFFRQSVERYRHWVAQGYCGEMQYLVRGLERRSDPRLVFPEVRSVLCVGLRYSSQLLGNTHPSEGPRYARYLRGGDYHFVIAEKLDRALRSIASESLKWKICVDTSAVLERTWGYLCGLGWIGKNSLLIHPKLGSYFLLGVVFLDRATGRKPEPLSNFCGNCTRCLNGCPTQAFVQPGMVDSKRCISYLTLEKRGEFESDELTLAKVGPWVAGCDICQEVCPFNRKVSLSDPLAQQEFPLEWKALLDETPEQYQVRIKATAMNRIKPKEFRRNVLLAFENSKNLQT